MPFDLEHPVPSNLLVHHPMFGLCYWVDDNGGRKLLRADNSHELMLTGVDLKKGWTLHRVGGQGNKFYVFEINGNRLGTNGADEKSAEQALRAQQGLTADAEVKFIFAVDNAGVLNKDNIETMQRNLDPKLGLDDPKLKIPENHAVETRDGIQPFQAPTDPSAPVIPPENSPGNTMHPNG